MIVVIMFNQVGFYICFYLVAESNNCLQIVASSMAFDLVINCFHAMVERSAFNE